eukprot:TRINITY_DN39370_c0_g1_i1.p1 TRINITY_DN39370_c0_g1~~TRINITY_DN39370_c0_g1_i1.p1  ORF type:complete len:369 (-),score=99.25 TRINITY_DN39370_c0_g1_i1:162-1268(-)
MANRGPSIDVKGSLSRPGSVQGVNPSIVRRASVGTIQTRSTVDGGGIPVKPRSPLHGVGASISGQSKPGERRPSKETAIQQVSRSKSEGRIVNRRNTIQVLPSQVPAELLDSPPPKKKLPKPSGPVRASVAMLVNKYRLDFHEVKDIVNAFESVKENSTGGLPLTRSELETGLGKVFHVNGVKPEIVDKVFQDTKSENGFLIEKFMEWYVLNMFTKVAALRGDERRVASDKLVYDLAQKFEVSAVLIDKIKQKFDNFDGDSSGLIDYDEFKQMISKILNAKSADDISEGLVKKFFKEIDVDGSGEVDFSEFSEWYLKYFNSTENPFDPMAGGTNRIIEQFYGSFDPIKQRQSTLAKQESADAALEAGA